MPEIRYEKAAIMKLGRLAGAASVWRERAGLTPRSLISEISSFWDLIRKRFSLITLPPGRLAGDLSRLRLLTSVLDAWMLALTSPSITWWAL